MKIKNKTFAKRGARLLIAILTLFFNLKNNAQVGVNIVTPDPSAALHVASPVGTFKGLLTPSVTSANRIAVASGTGTPADGLIVYDIDHKMHYYFQKATGRWVSMSPLVLSTSSSNVNTSPSGAITTPSTSSAFSLGINKQNPNKELDVVGNAAISGSAAIGTNLSVTGSISVTGFPVNALVPAGTIVMFNSATAPNGWAICDGSNGTPYLRGRFIVASGQATTAAVAGDSNPNYSAGTKGGENFHTLSKSELPKHTHEANADGSTISASGGSHTHAITVNGQVQGLSRAGGPSTGVAGDGSDTPTSYPSTHSHPTAEFSGHVGNGTTDGLNGQAHENRPQFFVLTFIMKL